MTETLAHWVIESLRGLGCREVVVCAGARNAELVLALGSRADFKVYRFFEERSAAFFALGRCKAEGRPVAVVTTSGTAAAEILPATIEAHYSGLPLVLVTADRPREYRGSGAPQTIEQAHLLEPFAEKVFDLEGEERANFSGWGRRRPLHLNICLPDPNPSAAKGPVQENVGSRIENCRRPLVILGPLPRHECEKVRAIISQWQVPVVAESLSGLRGHPALRPQLIKGGDRSLSLAAAAGWIDGIIRVGGVPTLRLWRDLEEGLRHLPVVSFSHLPFGGLSRANAPALDLEELASFVPRTHEDLGQWLEADARLTESLLELFRRFPASEPAWVRRIAARIPDGARVYLGNSLPIREWDLAADEAAKNFWIEGNRGANGIDGQASTALGFAGEDGENWALLGDLTALYDLASPWALRQSPVKNWRLVVLNNGGGKIFSRIFANPDFENQHDLGFKHWAEMWKMGYRLLDDPAVEWPALPASALIEVVPDEAQTAEFWTAYNGMRP